MGTIPEPYWDALALLRDFPEPERGGVFCRGASYPMLARIAHLSGWGRILRSEWYRVAEEIPLSEHHAAHILTRLEGAA